MHTFTSAQAGSSAGTIIKKKFDLCAFSDNISGEPKIKLDRKPDGPEDDKLIDDIKKWGYKWQGYAEKGKWNGTTHSVQCWEDKQFRARIKLTCANIAFYDPEGNIVDMQTYVERVMNFDPNAVDDDLSTLGTSKLLPETPDKRQRTS